MKTSKIIIRNLFGIAERTLDGHSIELSGPKGTGKTSVLDAIRFGLTNKSDRDYVIRQGADEGEILIETDTGLSINRKTRTNAADSVKVRDGSLNFVFNQGIGEFHFAKVTDIPLLLGVCGIGG